MTFISFSQTHADKSSTTNSEFSLNSELVIIHNDTLNTFHSEKTPCGIFVNGIFIGDKRVLNVMNPDIIESIKIEKEKFEKNGKEYYGKLLIETKSEYTPKFITLKELIKTHVELDENPIIFQINENIIHQDYNEYVVDENFILKIVVDQIKTSKKEVTIHLIKLITKTPENIKKENEIRIKEREI